jgi:hypothetical protein
MTRPRGVPRTQLGEQGQYSYSRLTNNVSLDDVFASSVAQDITWSSVEQTSLLAINSDGALVQATKICDNNRIRLEWRLVPTLEEALAKHGGQVVYD